MGKIVQKKNDKEMIIFKKEEKKNFFYGKEKEMEAGKESVGEYAKEERERRIKQRILLISHQ